MGGPGRGRPRGRQPETSSSPQAEPGALPHSQGPNSPSRPPAGSSNCRRRHRGVSIEQDDFSPNHLHPHAQVQTEDVTPDDPTRGERAVEVTEVIVREEVVNASVQLDNTVQASQVAPLLGQLERRVRGTVTGERGDLAERVNPTVPGPHPTPTPDASGWSEIDQLGAWQCALNPFNSLDSVPGPCQAKWAKMVELTLRAILTATDEVSLNRGLKWFLVLPQAFLRQAKRGGRAGRSAVAGRFNAAMNGDFESVIRLLIADRTKNEQDKIREAGKTRPQKSEEEIRQSKRKLALSHLQKGEIGKAVSRLTSFGMASIKDPAVMSALKAKYLPRGKDLPDSVILGQPVDNLGGLKDTLAHLPTGVSPGSGGLRSEFLSCLADVWDEATMSLLEEFGLLYLSGSLPHWWYRVWGCVTTVPLYKTLEMDAVRPVGVRNPLIRTLHSRVIRDNRATFAAVLEPQQLALSLAGGHKLVHQVRRAMEEHRDWVVLKMDVRNAHNEIWRSAIIQALESEPTTQHLAWFAAAILAPSTGLETGGDLWGEQGDGETQGDPKASAFFAMAIQNAVRLFDSELGAGGGLARFGNDDGYGIGEADLVFAALARLETRLREECGLVLQREKTEIFAWGDLPANTPPELKRAGSVVDGIFQPGFLCYGVPLGSDAYVRDALWSKAAEVERDLNKVVEVLAEDSQALWVALHRSLAHKMDYHLSLSYPSDILPVARHLDSVIWGAFERAVGQHVPRREENQGWECVPNIPVLDMGQKSFQEHFVRLPIRLRGFGLRALEDTVQPAFIGGVEMALGGKEDEAGWRQNLLDSNCRTGTEFEASWRRLQLEGEQTCAFLSIEFSGTLALGPAAAMSLKEGGSSRQALTEQREELREAALAEALRRHHDQAARPVRAYPQLDKLSTAWKLALPGPTNGLSSPVFREIMAQHLCLPSPACASIQGQRAGAHGGIVGPFGDELMTAHLPQDSWRTRHDLLKLELVKIANDARVPVEVEVFGLFRDIIPAEEFEDGGSLRYCRQRNGLCPDFKFRFSTTDGPRFSLGELKFISASASRYPLGRSEKQVDRRARELPGSYRRPLEKLDAKLGTPPGETGRLVARLQSYGPLLGLVAGQWGEASKDLHWFIQTCAEARAAYISRSSGQEVSEKKLGTIVSQYRRLVSTTACRAQAQCLLERISLITPEAKAAADRRALTMRRDEQLRQERQSQWMAQLSRPGAGKRGDCHTLL